MATRKKKYKTTRAKSPAFLAKKKTIGKKSRSRAEASPFPHSPSKKKQKRDKQGRFLPLKKRTESSKRLKSQKPVKRRRNKRGQFLPLKKRSVKQTKKSISPKKERASRRRTTPKLFLKRPKELFRKIRQKNLRKIPKAKRPKRRGKLIMRGAEGQERSIVVQKFWEKIKTGLLEEEIMRVYKSLMEFTYRTIPSLYTRFTFSVSHVETIMSAGSPKLLGIKRGNVKAWFLSTGMASTLEGARFRLQKGLELLEDTIQDSQDENPDGEFFLEFVTVRAYVVK